MYRFAGETIASDIDLALPSAGEADVGSGADVTVEIEPADRLPEVRIGQVLQDGVMSGMHWRFGTAPDPADGWVFGFGDAAAGTIDPARSRIHLVARRQVPDEWLGEAIVAWALVYRLAVGGRTTFHGSAVTLDGDTAVAVLGPTTSGKSTLAAASLALGASMIADDVLAPRWSDGHVVLDPTGTAVKLRGSAQALADHLDGGPDSPHRHTTFDDRLSVDAALASGPARLTRLFFLDPGGADGVHPIDPISVATRLVANAKVGVWTSADSLGDDFEAACDLADVVPGFTIGRTAETSSPSAETLLSIARSLFD